MRTVSGYGSIEYCAAMLGKDVNNTEIFENLMELFLFLPCFARNKTHCQ